MTTATGEAAVDELIVFRRFFARPLSCFLLIRTQIVPCSPLTFRACHGRSMQFVDSCNQLKLNDLSISIEN